MKDNFDLETTWIRVSRFNEDGIYTPKSEYDIHEKNLKRGIKTKFKVLIFDKEYQDIQRRRLLHYSKFL